MPYRKPMRPPVALTLSICDEEDDEDEDDVASPASAPLSGLSGSSGSFGSSTTASGNSVTKKVRSDSPEDNLTQMAANMHLRDTYEEGCSPEGSKKRGRGPPKRQDSFDVTKSMAFQQDGVRLKSDGMRNAGGEQVSSLSYDELENVRILGKGMSSKVWLKRHKPSGKEIAVKELSAMDNDDMRRMAVNGMPELPPPAMSLPLDSRAKLCQESVTTAQRHAVPWSALYHTQSCACLPSQNCGSLTSTRHKSF